MLNKSLEAKSRLEARKIMYQLHPKIDWHIHYIHHLDGNPLNNDLDNLVIMNRAMHTRLHCSKYKKRTQKLKFIIVY